MQLRHLPVSSSHLLLTLVTDGILDLIHLCILPVLGRMSPISVSYVVRGFFFLPAVAALDRHSNLQITTHYDHHQLTNAQPVPEQWPLANFPTWFIR